MINPHVSFAALDMDTVDGFDLLAGARLVTKAEYQEHTPAAGLLFATLTQALAAAANDSGLIEDHEDPDFFKAHVISAIGLDPEDLASPITYDFFTSMTLTESRMELLQLGYLATRGNGDTMDLHLALPAEAK
ncbi:hypothetical protein [Nonomuraea recticatena]|uniref:Uncharacterized protein n=1 Tax=Nonomuraea recticatena TaxID=46178 RepID=A0ABP6FVF6_9ACTN